MARILMTGAAGYIGSMLVPSLIWSKGHHVTAVDTFASGEPYLANECISSNLEIVRGDARDMRLMSPLIKDADIIISLAALVGVAACKRDEIGAATLNRDAVVNLVEACSKEQRIIIPTTNSGYGVGSDEFCTEESPLRPLSLYGQTKVDAEKAVLEHPQGISLRLATVFGMSPRMRLDLLVNDFTWRAVTDRAVVIFEGHFRRNFIHVRDVVKAFLHVIDRPQLRQQIYNVGLSEANLTKLQLCERIGKIVPGFTWTEAPVGEDADKRDYLVSNAKLEATGWKPSIDLDTGIRELCKGFKMIHNSRFSNGL